MDKGNKQRKRKIQPRAGQARPLALRHLPDALPLANVRPTHSRGPGPNRRILWKLNDRLSSLLPPNPPHRRCPGVLPTAVLPNPLPQPPDLRGPRPTLREQVMARLPLPAIAPPALVRPQPLGPGHSVMQEGANGSVPGQQLIVSLGRRLSDPAKHFGAKACSPRRVIPAFWTHMVPGPLSGGPGSALGGPPGEARGVYSVIYIPLHAARKAMVAAASLLQIHPNPVPDRPRLS